MAGAVARLRRSAGLHRGAGAGTLLSLDRVRQDQTRIRQAYLQRMSQLNQIRAQIYLSGTYVRDFLLSPDPSGAAAQTSRLTSSSAKAMPRSKRIRNW